MTESFDVIVLGTGGVGSAALAHLARRGVRVLGLDAYPPAHAHGSSHGESRIIRQAYFEHPDYVPLLKRAYQLWRQVEEESATSLFHEVGLLEVGPADGVLIPGIQRSVAEHNLPVDVLTHLEAAERFPFQIPDDHVVMFERAAGYLLVEECVRAHLQLAKEAGAEWQQMRVLDWSETPSHIWVETDSTRYQADHLIVAAGAWSAPLLRLLNIPLRVVAKMQYWLGHGSLTADPSAWPTYFFETNHGCYYGFPQISSRGPKVARHSGGLEWEQPLPLEMAQCAEDENSVRSFIETTLPASGPVTLEQRGCMYTMSPDEHFLVDRHPAFPRVSFAAGLSGHGFKFTSVLGEVLSQLALGESPELPIDFLRVGRFSQS